MDPQIRKKTLRMLSNGVYVLTARHGDSYGGATVTWVSQASFKPPLLMAAVRKESNVYRCFAESGVAALHIVGSDQKDLAQRFFAPTQVCSGLMNGEPFVEGRTSAPVLQNAPAYVECSVRRIVDAGGDHVIVVLEVLEAECPRQAQPLTIAESPWEYGG